MRSLNIAAAVSGAIALVMLAQGAHGLALAPPDHDRMQLAGLIQLAAACAGLAIANRSGRLNLIAGALILGGAALFALALYTISLTQSRGLAMLAPIGGLAMIAGWVLLAFGKPGH